MQLSVLNNPHVKKRKPAFVIEETKNDFVKQAKTRLKELKPKQRGLVEQLQPYNGNDYLRIMKDMVNPSKHRELLKYTATGDMEIILGRADKRDDYPDSIVYPAGNEDVNFYVRWSEPPTLRLWGEYNAMTTLRGMILHTETILWASSYFFCAHRNNPPNFHIEFGPPAE